MRTINQNPTNSTQLNNQIFINIQARERLKYLQSQIHFKPILTHTIEERQFDL